MAHGFLSAALLTQYSVVALGTAVVIGPYALVLPSGDGRMAFDCSVLFFLAGQ